MSDVQTESSKGRKGKGEASRINEEKWGKELWRSWVGIPSVIVRHQSALGLTPHDLNVLLYLVDKWGWSRPDDLPHPSIRTMAAAIGVSPRTVSRRLAVMEADGFIERHRRQRPNGGLTSNCYSFDGLKKKAAAILAIKKRRESARDIEAQSQAAQEARFRLTKRELDEYLASGGS